MGVNMNFIRKAESLLPQLQQFDVYPSDVIEVIRDEQAFQGWRTQSAGSMKALTQRSFGKGDAFVLDFGDHHVGYLTLRCQPTGSPADAPLRLKLIFGEMPCEIGEEFDDYDGWLSRSWLQDEIVNIDVLPGTIMLPRRYAFRYVKIEVLATSAKYRVQFQDIYCTAVTSADIANVRPLPDGLPEDLHTMDRVGVRTLQNCMQTVFEDGPKRDRRLWIGDLRLQALTNYYTFHNYDLVKRCLYLFAGMTLEGGEVGACLFEKPEPHVDDTLLYDYSLFFIAVLHDYYDAAKDEETLRELWPLAWEQVEIALRRVGENGIVKDDPAWWCFIDWHPELNKQAAAQAVLIYCLRRALALAKMLGEDVRYRLLEENIADLTEAAFSELFDSEQGFFVSGEARQVSWASQIWMALAGVLDQEANFKLLNRLFDEAVPIRPNTPYMYHHLIEALLISGNREKALEQMRAYWGEMVKDGADTFWEVYNPADKRLSPYGSNMINSYCHAWSCTTSYFIRKHFMSFNSDSGDRQADGAIRI